MSIFLTLVTGVAYLAFVAVLLLVVRRAAEGHRIQTFVNQVGLPLPANLLPVVISTQRREVRFALVSITAGLAFTTAGLLVAHVQQFIAIFFLDFTAVIVALGIGSAIGALALENSRQRSQVRFARLRSVGIADYRGRVERWAPRVGIVLALALFALRIAVTPGGLSGTPVFLLVYAGAMVASLVICEVASRALVRRGQPAGSETELVWDDALRARALNSIAIAPLYLGGYFTTASIASFPNSHSDAVANAIQLTAAFEMLFALAILVWVIRTQGRPQRPLFLRRLWPALAASPIIATAAETPVSL